MSHRSAPPRFHHVNLKTTRMDEMIEWYALAVGMHVTFRFDGGCWLTNDDANHRLAMIASPALVDDPDKLSHTGLHHTAFEFDGVDGLVETYLRLKDADELPHACLDHGMTMSFYYLDPDGNSVELQYDHVGDWSASTTFMQQDPGFAENPIGIPLDPDKLVEARRAGASQEEIHTRAYAGEWVPTADLDLRVPLG